MGVDGKGSPQNGGCFDFFFFLPESLLSNIKRFKRASLFIFFPIGSLISHYQLKSSVRTFLHYAHLIGSWAYSKFRSAVSKLGCVIEKSSLWHSYNQTQHSWSRSRSRSRLDHGTLSTERLRHKCQNKARIFQISSLWIDHRLKS